MVSLTTLSFTTTLSDGSKGQRIQRTKCLLMTSYCGGIGMETILIADVPAYFHDSMIFGRAAILNYAPQESGSTSVTASFKRRRTNGPGGIES